MQCFDFCNLFAASCRKLLFSCLYTFLEDAYVVLSSTGFRPYPPQNLGDVPVATMNQWHQEFGTMIQSVSRIVDKLRA